MNKSILTLAISGMLLSACVSVAAVKPGPFDIGKSYRVNVGETWTSYPKESRTHRQTLTIDGGLLNSLEFVEGLKEGESIVYSGDREKLIPKYRADMSANELTEFMMDSYAVLGLANGEVINLRPEAFGSLDGIRFDFTGDYETGLRLNGTVKIAQENGLLHMIIFYAPSEYYYGLRKDEVDKILASVTLL